MKLYEKIEKDTSGRNRIYNYYSACLGCSKEYKKQKAHAEGAPQEFYCSTKCYNLHTRKVELVCAHCKIKFYRNKSEIAKRVRNKEIHFLL